MHKDGMPSSPQVQYLLNRAGEPTDCGAMPCVQGRDRRGVEIANRFAIRATPRFLQGPVWTIRFMCK